MIRYECKTAQKGFAAGRARLVRGGKAGEYRQESPAEESARLEEAAAEMNRKLAERKERAPEAEAKLLEAEILMMNGDEFLGEARRGIRENGKAAPEALKEAAEKLCEMLRSSGSGYIRERCEDIRGLAAGMAALITGGGEDFPGEPCILAGSELSPGEITLAGAEKLLGILTETGSPTSHVSVLAGNLGIPYLYGLEGLTDKIADGDYLILDAEEGSVRVHPDAETIRKAGERQAAEKERAEKQQQAAGQKTRTRICANISRAEEADGLAAAGADGIGLFRSEFLFLNRAEAPGEEEQFEAYRHAAEAMGDRETVIRTMDIGSDKKAEWLETPEEINPALGLRGVRVSLKYRELFRTQLRALLRAAKYGNLRIMIPMVASVWELEETEKEIRAAAEELEARKEAYRIPDVGVMIETPAAVMIAPELAEKARFFSIGTNDLTQYTLAVDREARGMDEYFNPTHEAVMRMIVKTAEAAHAKGIPVAVCGELAGTATEALIRLGVDELSVSGAKLGRVRAQAAEAEKKSEKKTAAEKAPRKTGDIFSPADGELIPMEEIPDPVFSGGVMGECVGILPENGEICAPVSGTVTTVAATRHAVSLRGEDGQEILIHAGLDTVKLNGEGFKVLVKEGDRVQQGQQILEADIQLIRERGFSPMIIVVRIRK